MTNDAYLPSRLFPNPVPLWADMLLPLHAIKSINELVERDLLETAIPNQELIFRAFEMPPQDIRVVILGQDPYPNAHAMGLSFSSLAPTVPASLRNIYKELESDLGVPAPSSANLTHWVDQGVFLANAALTISRDGKLHHPYWSNFTRQWIRGLAARYPIVWILWGDKAKAWRLDILESGSESGIGQVIIDSVHPSPLSARHGFFGSRPFSRANAALRQLGKPSINWGSTEPAQQTQLPLSI